MQPAETSGGSWRRVENPRAARALTDPRERRFLEPFLGRERTVGVAARGAGVGLNRMYQQVERLKALGLVRVVRLEPRRGRAVKHYRSSAEGFFVPFSVTPFETVEALWNQTDAYWSRRLTRGLLAAELCDMADARGWGTAIGRDAEGRLHERFVRGPERMWAPAEPEAVTLAAWTGLRLKPERARELRRELDELWRRYWDGGAAGEGRPYLLRLALAPLEDG